MTCAELYQNVSEENNVLIESDSCIFIHLSF